MAWHGVEPTISSDLSAQSVAKYFLEVDAGRTDPDITQMKLHKLLYFAQANYLASTGKRLFDSNMEAFEHGPVISDIRLEYQKFGQQTIVVEDPHVASQDSNNPIPEDVKQFLERIWDRFGDLSASKLRRMSHEDAPWKTSYKPTGYRCPLTDESVEKWYRTGVQESRRVYHPNLIVIEEDLWNSLELEDDDEFAKRWASQL
ncbi:DUF4065 domain-containing protein [Kocuria indica]|uniref:Panacea domain-containing protein n=1 Tax=Kocuria marina TaxID=223184 RepID=UPI001EF6A339|nr:type II toxin-antitoxin system antitoxin SocA domain-containing protein [Kocuria indica]MCG7431880.1 DUF4065 domain-containing protein [Kocuria indica]